MGSIKQKVLAVSIFILFLGEMKICHAMEEDDGAAIKKKDLFIIKSFKPLHKPQMDTSKQDSTLPKGDPVYDEGLEIYYYGKNFSSLPNAEMAPLPSLENEDMVVFRVGDIPLNFSSSFKTSQRVRDNWEVVEDPKVEPWCVHGRLIMAYSKECLYLGSGTLIGDYYVLTAAHNFLNPNFEGASPLKIVFYVGVNGDNVLQEAEAE